jgi:mutator protein MutT
MAGGKRVMTEYIKSMRKHIGHERLMIIGGSVIVHSENRVLLQLRKDNECWGYHGGCVELGETIEEAVKRELFEETGLTANSLEFFGVFSGKELFYTYPNGDMVAITDIVYLCDDFSGEMIIETDETNDLRWFDVDKLPDNISPPVKGALSQCIRILNERRAAKLTEEK